MATTDRHIADEMWRELLDSVVHEWENVLAVKPEVTSSGVRLHISYGSLDMRFDSERRSVHVALRPCCELEDCPTPVSKRDIFYEPVLKSDGRRRWRRANFEHSQEGMAHLVIYHLLKHRGPA